MGLRNFCIIFFTRPSFVCLSSFASRSTRRSKREAFLRHSRLQLKTDAASKRRFLGRRTGGEREHGDHLDGWRQTACGGRASHCCRDFFRRRFAAAPRGVFVAVFCTLFFVAPLAGLCACLSLGANSALACAGRPAAAAATARMSFGQPTAANNDNVVRTTNDDASTSRARRRRQPCAAATAPATRRVLCFSFSLFCIAPAASLNNSKRPVSIPDSDSSSSAMPSELSFYLLKWPPFLYVFKVLRG
ncbi:hypothetical protein L596_000888 [Steinernema carpocapsae]|uniref:Uncharacterized protein n=1 Tax=Steinernema carpocapsae TaxID=34508 RepID=A0A4U8UJU9_STECR|nr:hypothetical protein L596_000888 [Steinernema carpocapsae]